MSNYVKSTNFGAKDTLPTGDTAKLVRGSDFDTEFDELALRSIDKANKVSSANNNNLVSMDATGDIKDSGVTTDGTGTITSDLSGNADTATAWDSSRTITISGDAAGDLDVDCGIE